MRVDENFLIGKKFVCSECGKEFVYGESELCEHLKDKLPAELIRTGIIKVADNNLSIGEKIKLIRIASGLSLEQFARKIGVRRSTVYNWENAKRNIRESTKKVIKVYFGYILDKLGISLD